MICLAAGATAQAATLQVEVRDAGGAPISDAVVTLAPKGGAKASAAPATRVVDQKDETFIPYVQVFRPGDRVQFANSDSTRHHVYSFSPVRAFEMVLAPGQDAAPLSLDRSGIVAVGCNIHDHMISYLYVSDAAYAARADAGRATVANLPAGEYAVRIWHPQLKRDQPEQWVKLSERETGRVAFELALAPDPRRARDRERSGY